MRSTGEIIVAVKESGPVSMVELKMALLALSSIEYFSRSKLDRLVHSIKKEPKTCLDIRVRDAELWRETRCNVINQDPIEWLGKENIPGNPEYEERMKMNKNIVKAATGIEL